MMISSTQHHTVEVMHLKVRETARKYDALVQRESAPSTAASASRAVETHALHRVSDLRARFEGVQGPLAMRHIAASAAPLAGSSRRFDVYGTALIHLHEQVATPLPLPLPHADADADSASDEHEYDQEYDHECDHGDVARADDVCVDAEHVGSASSNHATTIAGADAAAAATESDGAAAPAPSWFQIALHAFRERDERNSINKFSSFPPSTMKMTTSMC